MVTRQAFTLCASSENTERLAKLLLSNVCIAVHLWKWYNRCWMLRKRGKDMDHANCRNWQKSSISTTRCVCCAPSADDLSPIWHRVRSSHGSLSPMIECRQHIHTIRRRSVANPHSAIRTNCFQLHWFIVIIVSMGLHAFREWAITINCLPLWINYYLMNYSSCRHCCCCAYNCVTLIFVYCVRLFIHFFTCGQSTDRDR